MDLVTQLAEQFRDAAQAHGRLVAAIDGPGCCGKTLLAEGLARIAGAAVLGTDDFHLPRGEKAEIDSPIPYRRWTAFITAADELARGRPMERIAVRDGAAVARNWAQYIALEQAYLRQCRPWDRAHLWVYGAGLTTGNADLSFSRLIERQCSSRRS